MKKIVEKIQFGLAGLNRLIRKPKVVEPLKFFGHFHVKHLRKGELIGEYDLYNALTNEGKNAILDLIYNQGTGSSHFYMLLIDNSGYTALAASDTYANINQSGNGWDEFGDYTDPGNSDSAVSRPEWSPGAAASQAVTNGSAVLVDINATGTVKGLAIVYGTSAQTKGDHTSGGAHKLVNTTLFSGGDRAVADEDQLQITFTVSL